MCIQISGTLTLMLAGDFSSIGGLRASIDAAGSIGDKFAGDFINAFAADTVKITAFAGMQMESSAGPIGGSFSSGVAASKLTRSYLLLISHPKKRVNARKSVAVRLFRSLVPKVQFSNHTLKGVARINQ